MSRINQQVYQYIQNALKQGHDLNSIKQWLLKYNIPENEINEALTYFQPSSPVKPLYSSNIVEVQMRNYINNQLHSGYTINAIRSALLAQGYDPSTVSRIINEQTLQVNIKHEVHFSAGTIFGVFLLILLVGGGALVFLNFETIKSYMFKETPLLDVSIQATRTSYYAGGTIDYQITLISTGSRERFDVNARYILYDQLNLIKKSYSETIAVETRTVSSGSIDIPKDLPPGIYFLKAIVEYGQEYPSESTIEISILSKDQPLPVEIPPEDIETPPPDDVTLDNGSITPKPQSGVKFGDVIDAINEQATTDAQGAANNCAKFGMQTQKDTCYSLIAERSGKIQYCDLVTNPTYKDGCLIQFAFKDGYIKEGTVLCEKIADNATRAYCEQIRIVALMNYYYQQNRTDKIVELSAKFNSEIYNTNPSIIEYENVYNEEADISVADINFIVGIPSDAQS